MLGLLVERSNPFCGVVPQNMSGISVTTNWIGLRYYRNLLFAIQQGAWAGGTPAVTVNQAQDNAGTGSKSATFNKMYQSLAGTTGSAGVTDVLATTAVTSNTFNLPAVAGTFTVVEIIGETDLDVANGFCFCQLSIASPGSNADYIAILTQLFNGTWEGKPDTHPSSL